MHVLRNSPSVSLWIFRRRRARVEEGSTRPQPTYKRTMGLSPLSKLWRNADLLQRLFQRQSPINPEHFSAIWSLASMARSRLLPCRAMEAGILLLLWLPFACGDCSFSFPRDIADKKAIPVADADGWHLVWQDKEAIWSQKIDRSCKPGHVCMLTNHW